MHPLDVALAARHLDAELVRARPDAPSVADRRPLAARILAGWSLGAGLALVRLASRLDAERCRLAVRTIASGRAAVGPSRVAVPPA